MTSLALLAHATSAAAPPFNGLFYATAATIIPVLFLAIAVQGRLYGDLLKVSVEAMCRMREQIADPSHPLRLVRPAVVGIPASFAAAAILAFGVDGEIQALVSLYRQQDYGNGPVTITAAMLLTLAAAAGPAAAGVRQVVNVAATAFSQRGDRAPTEGEANSAHRTSTADERAETGETDTEE